MAQEGISLSFPNIFRGHFRFKRHTNAVLESPFLVVNTVDFVLVTNGPPSLISKRDVPNQQNITLPRLEYMIVCCQSIVF